MPRAYKPGDKPSTPVSSGLTGKVPPLPSGPSREGSDTGRPPPRTPRRPPTPTMGPRPATPPLKQFPPRKVKEEPRQKPIARIDPNAFAQNRVIRAEDLSSIMRSMAVAARCRTPSGTVTRQWYGSSRRVS